MISLFKTWMPKLYIPKLWPNSCWRNFLFDVFSWSGNIPRASKIQVNITKKYSHVTMYWLLNSDIVAFFFGLKTKNCFIFSFSTLTRNIRERRGSKVAINIPSRFIVLKQKKKEKESKTKVILSREMGYFYSKLLVNIHFKKIFKKKCLNTVLKTWHPILDSWNYLVKNYLVRRAGFQCWIVLYS